MNAPSRRRIALLTRALAVVPLIVLGACSHASSRLPGTPVDVIVQDFKISADRVDAPSGTVVMAIDNRGPSTHELVVVRTDLPPEGLPLRSDGLTIDEDSSLIHSVGENGDIGLGDRRTLVLQLPPGHYVMFCNLEGHYLGGMRLGFDVRSDGQQA